MSETCKEMQKPNGQSGVEEGGPRGGLSPRFCVVLCPSFGNKGLGSRKSGSSTNFFARQPDPTRLRRDGGEMPSASRPAPAKPLRGQARVRACGAKSGKRRFAAPQATDTCPRAARARQGPENRLRAPVIAVKPRSLRPPRQSRERAWWHVARGRHRYGNPSAPPQLTGNAPLVPPTGRGAQGGHFFSGQ